MRCRFTRAAYLAGVALLCSGVAGSCVRAGFSARGDGAVGDAPRGDGPSVGDLPRGDGDPPSSDSGGSSKHLSVAVPAFGTPSKTFVDVPGAKLTIPPTPLAQPAWVVLFSAALSASSGEEASVECRYLVDGVERGLGAIQSADPSYRGSWQHAVVVPGGQKPREIAVQLRDQAGVGVGLHDLSIVAFQLPQGAELQASEAESTRRIPPGAWTGVLALNLAAAAPTDYLVIAVANASEAPGTGSIGVRLGLEVKGAKTTWPSPVSGIDQISGWANPRTPRWAFFAARKITVHGSAALTLEAQGSRNVGPNQESEINYARLFAFRTSVFDVAFIENTTIADITTKTTTAQISSSVTPMPTGSWLLLRGAFVHPLAVGPDAAAVVQLTTNDQSHSYVLGSPGTGDELRVGFGRADRVQVNGLFTATISVSAATGAATVVARDSFIYALRLPDS